MAYGNRGGREVDQFAGFLEAVPDAMLGVDAEGRILMMNTQAAVAFGYSKEELVGQKPDLLWTGPAEEVGPEQLAAFRAKVFAAGDFPTQGVRVERTLRRKDGSTFPAEISLAAVSLNGQRILTEVVRDVSERVAAQLARDRLEAQHERDRLERQLHQSQRLESLGQLAGGVAHDFNNLLAAILNFVNFASEELANEVERRGEGEAGGIASALADVRQIGAAAERAARLTHQLLAFSRREVIQPEVLDLNSIVQDVETLLRRTIGEHVKLQTEYGNNLWLVNMDRGQLEQVLLNLVVNARDAMENGGRLTIQTSNVVLGEDMAAGQADLKAGEYVRLRVSDSGEGMTPEVLTHAFEPFFTTKGKDKGSGLGLATVYGIVAQAGGSVNLYSEVGLGTTVTILLPRTGGSLEVSEIPTPVKLRGEGETILVVEDEALVREVASRILGRNGYRVLVAAGAEEGLQIIEREGEAISLLLTDLVMPGLSGKALARQVGERFPSIKVLYMSGYPVEVVSAQGVVEAGVRLISKPFVEPELLENVKMALEE